MSVERTVTKITREEAKAITPEFWANTLQPELRKSLVSAVTTNSKFDPDLQYGDTLTYSYFSGDNTVIDYINDVGWFGAITDHEEMQVIGEELKVDKTPLLRKKVDRIEELYTNIDAQIELRDQANYALRDWMDQEVFKYVDEAKVAANGGDPITLTGDNLISTFATFKRQLRKANVEDDGSWIVIIDPEQYQVIEEVAAARGTALGDGTFINGYGGRYMGFDIYVSNNLMEKEVGGEDCVVAYVGRQGMIHTAFKAQPSVELRERQDSLGFYLYFYSVFGVKVFEQYSKRFLKAYFKTEAVS